jgi:uncharacterized protein (TIGR03437 family)
MYRISPGLRLRYGFFLAFILCSTLTPAPFHSAQANQSGCTTLSFRAAPHVAVRVSTINDVVAGDFNSDGNPDAVVAHPQGVIFLAGDGRGDFGLPHPTAVAGEPQKLFRGDFNGDAQPDLIAAGKTNHALLLNTGGGNFQAVAITAFEPAATRLIALGDFNGDRRHDLLTANNAGGLALWLQTGTNSFQAGASLNNSSFGKVAVGDFNSDGRDDVAYTRPQELVTTLLFSLANGGFREERVQSFNGYPNGLVTGDFDGNQRQDLAISTAGGSINQHFIIAFNQPQGLAISLREQFIECSSYLEGPPFSSNFPPAGAAGDFNGDGKDDVAFQRGCSDNLILFVNGNRQDYAASGALLTTADFNRDGRTDFLLRNPRQESGNAYFTKMLSHAVDGYTASPAGDSHEGAIELASGDFDGDALSEIAHLEYGSISHVSLNYRNNPRFFQYLSWLKGLTALDGNGDGFPDLFANYADTGLRRPTLAAYLGGQPLSPGYGDAATLDLSLHNPHYVDLNGDAQVDLLDYRAEPPNLSLYLNDGYTRFRLLREYTGTQLLLTGDFNADQLGDLIVKAQDTRQLWLGQGQGAFTAMNLPTELVTGQPLLAADLTSDGKNDLVWQETNTRILLLPGLGDGTFGTARVIEAGLSQPWHQALAVDLNADGKLELVGSHNGTVVVLPNLGEGRFGAPLWLAAPDSYQRITAGRGGLTAGDFNGDSKIDLAHSFGGWSYYLFYNTSACDPLRSLALKPSSLSREQGSRAQPMQLAKLSFPSALPGDARITASAPAPSGVTLANVQNVNGVMRAEVAVSCTAPVGITNLNLSLTSASGTHLTATVPLNIRPNQSPGLNFTPPPSYENVRAIQLYSSNPIAEHGAVRELALDAPTLPGSKITVYLSETNQAWGRIDVPAFAPPGRHTLTATAKDACGATTTARFELAITEPPRTTVTASAASYQSAPFAPGQIVTVFGTNLATTTQTAQGLPLPTNLAGAEVRLEDGAGKRWWAPLFFASPGQINYLIPADITAPRVAAYIDRGIRPFVEILSLAPVAPGLFTANANGQGIAAAQVLRVLADGTQRYEPVARYDEATKQFVAVPIDLSNPAEQVFLILYGTGIRGRTMNGLVTATVGRTNAEVLFAGPQGSLAGLDQVNLRLPRTLIGRGEVDVALTIDGKAANVVRVAIR